MLKKTVGYIEGDI